MFDTELIAKGHIPRFALINYSYIDLLVSNEQLKLFSNRVQKENIKTQILESENDTFLLVLFIKDDDDDESLEFLLNNLVEEKNIITADKIILK